MGRNLELAIGALNGLVGDYLHKTGNGLATEMQVVRDGAALPVTREALSATFSTHSSGAPRRLAIFVHGLMSTEDVWRMDDGASYGSLLSAELGVASVEVRFNSGLRISQNGEQLDDLLTRLMEAYPAAIEEIWLLGHSMGGLVIRSACHAASERGSPWLPLAKRAFYIGSPHLGAPLERAGNVLTWALGKIPNPITALIAEIGNLRSQGVKDLRYGNLRREDWEGADADALLQNRRHPVPLLPHIRHHLIAGSLSTDLESRILFGDIMVPVRSAAGKATERDRAAPFPEKHFVLLPGMNHLRLAHDRAVYAHLRAWAEEPLE